MARIAIIGAGSLVFCKTQSTNPHPTHNGALPLATLNMTNVLVQGPSGGETLSGVPELLGQAVAPDPLAAARLAFKKISNMTTEMLETQRAWLPQYAGLNVKLVPTISIPKDGKRQLVLVDPARAVANCFSQPAELKTCA
jgi:alpha-galactosidase